MQGLLRYYGANFRDSFSSSGANAGGASRFDSDFKIGDSQNNLL
jgi:hypothetical protein